MRLCYGSSVSLRVITMSLRFKIAWSRDKRKSPSNGRPRRTYKIRWLITTHVSFISAPLAPNAPTRTTTTLDQWCEFARNRLTRHQSRWTLDGQLWSVRLSQTFPVSLSFSRLYHFSPVCTKREQTFSFIIYLRMKNILDLVEITFCFLENLIFGMKLSSPNW